MNNYNKHDYLFYLAMLSAFCRTKEPNLFFISSRFISSLASTQMNFFLVDYEGDINKRYTNDVSMIHFSTTLEEYL